MTALPREPLLARLTPAAVYLWATAVSVPVATSGMQHAVKVSCLSMHVKA